MPTGIGDLSALDGLFKDVYQPGITSWVERDLPMLSRIEKGDRRHFEGRRAVIGFKEANNQKFGTRAENTVLPTAGKSTPGQMYLSMAHHYAILGLTRQVVSQSASNKGAYMKAVDNEVESAQQTMKEGLARQYVFGDGTGWVARVKSLPGGVSLAMYTQPTDVGFPGSRLLRVGMELEAYASTAAGATQRVGTYTVVTVTPGSATVVFDGVTNVQAGDYLFLKGSFRTDAMGLGGLIDDGGRVATLQTMTRSAKTGLNANVLTNSGTLRAWSPTLMDQLCGRSRQLTGAGRPTLLASRMELQQKAVDYLRRDKRYDPQTVQFNGGYKAIMWSMPGADVPWLDDFYCRDNEIDAIHEPDLMRYVLEEIQFDDWTGSQWIESSDRTHSYESRLFTFQNLGQSRGNWHSRLEDLSYTL